VFSEIGEDIGNFSVEMDQVKSKQFRTILDLISMHMEDDYLDAAEIALKKLALLNRKFGTEFNDFMTEIYNKEALCLK
jgi:hypothetical protein